MIFNNAIMWLYAIHSTSAFINSRGSVANQTFLAVPEVECYVDLPSPDITEGDCLYIGTGWDGSHLKQSFGTQEAQKATKERLDVIVPKDFKYDTCLSTLDTRD